ncbi:Mediator of RNA polymerase II transcription subunit 10b [Camellia lanceoleosa]|uniref:Mediator of RNA polymerase II transcription subunit 10b n=1 Tax=Camellia lanceoleosa TaxID=1840588 RepID=A0ACC0FF49_9ERIC|nr:Mediator of RNA polymerase II transcription subunit 10b [Camellia lanceoleosa]
MDSSQNSGGIINPQQNNEASTTERTGNDPKQNLNQVINSIQKTLGLIHQLYLTVSSFNVASQLPLLQRLLQKHHLEELEQAFPDEVESYREIRATSATVFQSLIPYNLLRYFPYPPLSVEA